MSIYFITGRPGAGKGLYCMRLLVAELRGSNRKIITNFPVKAQELNEYLHEEFGESFDLLDRLICFHGGEEEKHHLRNFYLIREAAADGTPIHLEKEVDAKGRSIGYDIAGAQTGGVFYLLDEVHLVFGARQWMELGRAVMEYSSQHRKLGDDCVMVSQVPKQVDSQLRNLAQSFSTLTNHGKLKWFCFKQPNVFSRYTYLHMPNRENTDDALESSTFRIDLAQANCYDSAAGVGLSKIEGIEGDVGKDTRTGISWLWGIPIVVGCVAGLIWVLMVAVPGIAKKGLRGMVEGSQGIAESVLGDMDANKTEPSGRPGQVLPLSSASLKDRESIHRLLPPGAQTNGVRITPALLAQAVAVGRAETYSELVVTGWGFHAGTENFFVILSNFSKLSLDTGSLKEVRAKYAVGADGTKYKYEFGFLDVNKLLRQ